MGVLSLGNSRKGHVDVDVVLHSEVAAIESNEKVCDCCHKDIDTGY